MTPKTIVRPELDIKAIASRLEETARDARGQVEVLDHRVATGHDLTDSDETLKLNMLQIASDCRDALHRIELGTFGLCLQCDEPIDEERIRQYPYAPLCLRCKKGKALPGPGQIHRSTAAERAADRERARPCKQCGATIPGHIVRELNPELCLDCLDKEPDVPGEGASTGNGEGGGPVGTPAESVVLSPSPGPLPRDTCPICDRSVPVRRNGAFREHMTIDRGSKKCRGSGVTKAELGHHQSFPVPAAATTEPSSSPPQEPAKPAGAGDEKQFADLSIPHITRGGSVDMLPVAQIKPSSKNPRTEVGDVTELAASILSIGLLQPLVVVKSEEGGYDLVAGHRRFKAMTEVLGWQEVPVVIFNLSDKEQLEARLIENIHRSDLSALEEAKALQQLIEIHGMSQRELSERIGRSQSHISKRIGLMDLPEKAAELVDSGGITHEDAQKLLKLKDDPKRMEKALDDFDPKSNYHTIDRAVAVQLGEIKRNERVAKARAKVKEQGLTIIAYNKWLDLPYKTKASIGTGYNSLDVSLEEHKVEECHRVYIDSASRAPSPVHVCIDVARHKKSGASKLKGKVGDGSGGQRTFTDEDRERQAMQKRGEALNKVSSKRVEFIVGLLAKKVSKDDAFEACLLAALSNEDQMADPYQLCEALGIKAPRRRDADETGRNGAERALAEFASKPENKPKLLLASALHVLEQAARFAASQSTSTYSYAHNEPCLWLDVTGYLAFLEERGYEISELELEEVAKADARVEEAKAKTKKKSSKKGAAA